MQLTLMKGKIHRASVTQADLHYESAISIDRTLLDAAGFLAHERVEIFNIDTGARFTTYVIDAPPRVRHHRLAWCSRALGNARRQNHHRCICLL